MFSNIEVSFKSLKTKIFQKRFRSIINVFEMSFDNYWWKERMKRNSNMYSLFICILGIKKIANKQNKQSEKLSSVLLPSLFFVEFISLLEKAEICRW